MTNDIVEQAAQVLTNELHWSSNPYDLAQALADAGLLRDGVTPEHITQQRENEWPDIHPEDYCHRCGNPNPSWATPRTYWETATQKWAQQTGREGICCPTCFDQMHQEATGKLVTWWIHPWNGEPCAQPDRTVPAREEIADVQDLEMSLDRVVIRDADGDIYERQGELETERGTYAAWLGTHTGVRPSIDIRLPATVIYTPGEPASPARTVPTREQIAAALYLEAAEAEDGDIIFESPDQIREEIEGWHRFADAVLALMAGQPTVEEAKARALEEAADAFDALQTQMNEHPSRRDPAIWLIDRAEQIRDGK